MPSSPSSRSLRPVRTTAWSSAITTLISLTARRLAARHPDHRRTVQPAGAQVVQRRARLLERVRRDRGADRDPRCQGEELVAIAAGEVGDRADRALAPEVLVR